MAAKRTGLGRGIGALIPTGEATQERPVDVFFPGASTRSTTVKSKEKEAPASDASGTKDEPASGAPQDADTADLVAVP